MCKYIGLSDERHGVARAVSFDKVEANRKKIVVVTILCEGYQDMFWLFEEDLKLGIVVESGVSNVSSCFVSCPTKFV